MKNIKFIFKNVFTPKRQDNTLGTTKLYRMISQDFQIDYIS